MTVVVVLRLKHRRFEQALIHVVVYKSLHGEAPNYISPVTCSHLVLTINYNLGPSPRWQVARLQEENRELKTKVQALKDSDGGIPLDLSREFEQRVKRLEAELEVAEDQRRKASQEVVKLQSQLSESHHAARGHKEVLVSEVSSFSAILNNSDTVGES